MTAKDVKPLKLLAFDAEDLAVLAAHLQDAVVAVGEMAYLRRERRFALLANRFDWASALSGDERKSRRATFLRRRTALRFEHVKGAQLTGFDRSDPKQVLSLLTIQFTPIPGAPDGHVVLSFAGGGAVRLEVECLEAEMRDLGAVWATPRKPMHPDDTST